MASTARVHFDKELGWQDLPGYKPHHVSLRGSLPSGEILNSGIEVDSYSSPARTDISLLRFSNFAVAHVETTPVSASWAKTRVPARRRYLVVLVNHGTVIIRENGSTSDLTTTGVAIFPPGSAPLSMQTVGYVEGILFSFDKNEIDPLEIDDRSVVFASDDSPVYAPIYALLASISSSTGQAGPNTANTIRGLLRSAAKAVITASMHVSERGGHSSFESIRALVENRYQSTGFTVDEIAKELGKSRRAIERLAKREGQSPSRMLRTRRAEHARVLIEANPNMPLTKVASESGFRSLDAMRRALLTTFGHTPRELKSRLHQEDEM